jgi:hypothetical protein
MPELCKTGWVSDGQPFWHETSQSWWKIPFVADLVSALEEAYETPADPAGVAARVEQFRASNVFANHWVPALENMAERINPQAVAA